MAEDRSLNPEAHEAEPNQESPRSPDIKIDVPQVLEQINAGEKSSLHAFAGPNHPHDLPSESPDSGDGTRVPKMLIYGGISVVLVGVSVALLTVAVASASFLFAITGGVALVGAGILGYLAFEKWSR